MKASPQSKTAGPPPAPFDMAMLAHDMRSALHGVMGGVAMLDDADLSPDAREQVDRVSAASKNLARLIGILLSDDGGADRNGGLPLIEVRRFLRHLSKRWTGEARERGMRFAIDAAEDAPGVIRADRALLSRALGNLIGNATRHVGYGALLVEVRRSPDGGAVFAVIDEGPGVPQQNIDDVFRSGSRPPEISAAGHGLGMHIVRNFCVEMEAEFSLVNRPLGGAAASIAFPGRLCADAVSVTQPQPSKAARTDLSGVRILLAEDNPTNQVVATQMLRALNAEVTLSSDGVEAMERFEAGVFDLIVVDIEMPRMTGLDVIRVIRGRKDGREAVPIVALTAYAMREHRDRIAAAGANGLISKPITSVEALGQALRVHVAPTRRAQTNFAETPAGAFDEPVADLEIFDALCAAIGAGMMAELLEKVVADLMQARGDLAGALETMDRKPIRSASHILISVAGAVGATRLQSCARALNTAAHGENEPGLPAEVRRCLDEIDAAVAFANMRRGAADAG